jgi:hypothetical protein
MSARLAPGFFLVQGGAILLIVLRARVMNVGAERTAARKPTQMTRIEYAKIIEIAQETAALAQVLLDSATHTFAILPPEDGFEYSEPDEIMATKIARCHLRDAAKALKGLDPQLDDELAKIQDADKARRGKPLPNCS